jgi:Flp pilus assembly protein TadG
MKFPRFLNDICGATALEFGMTAPAFVLLMIAIVQGGLMFWTQLGLQQGVEMGARCASVNTILCDSTSAVQTYAAQATYGVNPPASTFSVAWNLPCGTQVSASYAFPIISNYFGAATLQAQSCFPK